MAAGSPDRALAQMPADAVMPSGGSLLHRRRRHSHSRSCEPPALYPQRNLRTTRSKPCRKVDHYHAWVDAALGGPKTTDHFDYAGPLTEAVHLGNAATRMPGVTLEWDAAKLRFPNKPDADRFLTRPYRDGWKIEPVG